MNDPVLIRPERSADAGRIRAVNLSAFEGSVEANIVDRLRAAGAGQLSLVAEARRRVGRAHPLQRGDVGDAEVATGMGLAPMAVLPAHQSRGVGSTLVRRGLEMLRAGGCPFVVVLGHPTYYPRFGFVPASRYGIESEFDGVPDEAFLALELAPGGLEGVSGVARYRPEFGAAV